MIITYRPQGQNPQVWEWNPGRLRMSEAAQLEEKAGGGGLDTLRMGVLQGDSKARRIVLWSLLKRDHPTIKFEDVDPYAGEVTVEPTQDELVEWRDALVKARGVDEDKRRQFLDALDAEIEAGQPVGKAPSKKSA